MGEGIILKKNFLKQRKLEKPIRVWGIDLGTTNSTVTEITWSPSKPNEYPICQSLEVEQTTTEGVFTSPLVPSVVALHPSGEIWVGEGAKRLRSNLQKGGLIFEKNLFFDTKNEMGLKKSYFRAIDSHNAPWKIAGHILAFLNESAEKATTEKADHIVVTVPASFQLNQRRDTLRAADLAQLGIKAYDLLDEPTAALLDYLMNKTPEQIFKAGTVSNVLVFDFGGGTCDVSIVRIEVDAAEEQLKASMLSVSRYHRLGGSDIDTAIVHEQLIPVIITENKLQSGDLSWSQKKRTLEPQLLSTAESLKIAVCKEIERLKKFGKYDSMDKAEVIAKQPGVECQLGKQRLSISRPQLSALALETILEPFLDSDFLFARETEYRLTQSIFAPIQDALERAQLSSEEIDFVLLVGGSTLIPQVKEAVAGFFSESQIGTFEDYLDVQLSVSRGAAWHAFLKEVTGRPFIQPVTGDTIAILTGKDAPYTLVQAGTPVPYPPDGSYARLTNLAIPKSLIRNIKMDIIALSTGQSLFSETWKIQQMVNAGDPITVEFRIGGNQEFECRAFLANAPGELFERTIENPLVNTISPDRIRIKIEEMEEKFRNKGGFKAEDRDKLIQLARWYSELKQLERAQEYLKTALRLINRPDAEILNLLGINYGELGDIERQAKAYREADSANPHWGGPMFNLSLALRNRNKHKEALQEVEKAIQKEKDRGSYHTLKGLCMKSHGDEKKALEVFRDAINMFGPVEDLSDWDLGWFETCCSQLDNADMLQKIEKERQKRNRSGTKKTVIGEYPNVAGGLKPI